MRRFGTRLFQPPFRRLPFYLLCLFKQTFPIELVGLGFRKDAALLFVDMFLDQFSEHVKPCIKRRRARSRSEPIQFVEQDLYESMFLDSFVNPVRILKGYTKGRINDPLFNGRMDGKFANDPVRNLRLFSFARLGVLREQGTHQLVVIAQQLNDVRKGAEQAFEHVCLTASDQLIIGYGENNLSRLGGTLVDTFLNTHYKLGIKKPRD